MRIVCWFSCGVTSAIATKLALETYGKDNFVIAYCDTNSEHPDNMRFLRSCEIWFDYPITILKSPKYNDIWDVYEKTNYIAGIGGARCSLEMKKRVRQDFEDLDNDIQIFGFDCDEADRADRFRENNPEVVLSTPLIDRGISKLDCVQMLYDAEIDLPSMYKLGYKNNNCIGCPKGAKGYWNKIRVDFPNEFQKMADMEQKLGAALNIMNINGKRVRVPLYDLPIDAGNYKSELPIQCGLLCE